MRYLVYYLTLAATVAAAAAYPFSARVLWLLVPAGALAALGTYDVLQRRHNLWRNYPIIARFRWLFEAIRPELRQYLFESDTDGRPFSREQRSLVYRRAKDVNDKSPFGTLYDVTTPGYEWIRHSLQPVSVDPASLRVEIGSSQCTTPYPASVLNISAMSFGALSANAIRALNEGARQGGFAHDTGEGGISEYHRIPGGDLIWEIGSGYFGTRDSRGRFDPERFEAQAASSQVRMIEIKLSQGAKPGHGGMLPGPKVTAEIAAARQVPAGVDCVSPARHTAFDTPIGLLEFIARLRELAGGKPVGFKLCIGDPAEFMAIVKAMLETGIRPDFIVIDGGEGGTGAAPLELANRVGMPLREALVLAHDVLVGADLRDEIRLAASGKITSGYFMAANMALGADWCNAARGFMFALGCVQSLSCHTDRCPTGVATQDPRRQSAIVVPDKARRVANFHRNTVAALAEVLGVAGVPHPGGLTRAHLMQRDAGGRLRTAAELYPPPAPGQLLSEPPAALAEAWRRARADRFGAS